jgi:hypothetical protein
MRKNLNWLRDIGVVRNGEKTDIQAKENCRGGKAPQ